MADFCHLHVHTEYSLLDGACRIDKVAEKAVEMGMPAVAMTDHGNMFGAVSFHKTMNKHGVKPIIGYEGYLTLGNRTDRSYGGGQQDLYHLTLLARNQTGYQNLLKLTSLAYTEGLYYKPRMDQELLENCAEGIICLTGCLKSRLNDLLLADAPDEARKWLAEMQGIFGPEYFFVEIQDHGLEEQQRVLPKAVQMARDMDIPIVATNDSHYLEAKDREAHDVLLCISTRSTLDDPDRFRMDSGEIYFKSPEEMAERFSDYPDALSNTLRIAEICEVQLDESPKFPAFERGDIDDNAKHLRELVHQGLEGRYGSIPDEMEERLNHELDIIEQMGYVDYFLIVWDFVRFAREEEIPVGMRGSGSSSVVAHALGLTDFNPMDYDLIFSRFLDPERREQPDIDIDLCERRREEVIDYVRQQYGENSTAQIITFGTLMARNCVRDVGRVLDISLDKVDGLAKMIPTGPGYTLEKGLEEAPELRKKARNDEDVEQLLEYALQLEGLPRHASTHAAGVVIADKPLWELVPLYKSGDGAVMTQWAMDDLEKMGMLKMDFLGLNTLTIIQQTLDLIEDGGETPPDLDAAELDLEDEQTYKLLGEGRTKGVFQFGSQGMQQLLRRLQPNCMEDLIAVVALYRPGPLKSGMVEDFIDRKHGRAQIEYPHPDFEPVLKPTYGVIVYQEQIMRMAHEIAGMSMAQALTMIKAISKKKASVIDKASQDFIDGAVKNGLDRDTATNIYELISHFAGYGFNKAHASAYAFVAYRTAFLKAHYPTEFMAGSISCEMGDTDKVVGLMEECKSLGIEVLPPDINESKVDFTVIEDGTIRFGFGAVKNVGTGAAECIIEERQKNGPYRSIFEFCERVDPHQVGKGAVEALMKGGCFDELPGRRSQQLAVLERAIKAGAKAQQNRAMGQTGLFGKDDIDPETRAELNLPDSPPYSPMKLAKQESEALGLYVRHDPLQEHRARLRRLTSNTSDQLEAMEDNTRVVVGGIVENIKKRRLKDKRQMAVLKVLDVKGTLECVLWPETREEHEDLINSEDVLLFRGQVSQRRGTSVIIDDVLPLQRAAERLVGAVLVQIPCREAGRPLWTDLQDVFARSEGQIPVYFDLVGDDMTLRCEKSRGNGVAASERLAAEIEDLLGEGTVFFSIETDKSKKRSKKQKGTG
ncbi:MAG: DNA polymerase III subunit alpha [Planctomycetes bacterium]|nr:DNA polymerase III subunit alpha [Planctomycetota bacterium]